MSELSLIDTIVKYSKECITLKFIINHLSKSKLLVKMLPPTIRVPSINTIDIPVSEIRFALSEIETTIGQLLTPLFEGKDFDYKEGKQFSLSSQEIKDGYILLKEIARRDETGKALSYKPSDFVILLRGFTSSVNGFWYEPATLYEVGRSIREDDLLHIAPSDEALMSDPLLKLLIKKKYEYGYLERLGNKED